MDNCNDVYNIIGGTGLTILLIVSELLPFIKDVKSNGLLEILIRNYKSYKPSIDEENPLINS